MPETGPTKTIFEQTINSARQQTEGYCANAYRLLQMNSAGYSLLASWEDRIRGAIRERDALLKSSRELLTLLEEDTDALKLLRQEIAVRLDRQEKDSVA